MAVRTGPRNAVRKQSADMFVDNQAAMIPRYKHVFVCCHGATVTGGPEAAHQLVHLLGEMGATAAVSYIPFGRTFNVPEAFRAYDIQASQPLDEPGNIIIVPETAAYLARKFQYASTAVWWLSVDAFFSLSGLWPGRNSIERKVIQFVSRHRRWLLRREINELRGSKHFVQSKYAAEFLKRNELPCLPLSDYVNVSFSASPLGTARRDAIAYSRKGLPTVKRLMKRYPSLTWIPIQGMSRAQVRELLSSVKLYIDFGGHPGKDRMPREAALCGTCVITGRQGSARFVEDVPIPEAYKLDEKVVHFEQNLHLLVREIFGNFEIHQAHFEHYRAHIRNETARFKEEIKAAFFKADRVLGTSTEF